MRGRIVTNTRSRMMGHHPAGSVYLSLSEDAQAPVNVEWCRKYNITSNLQRKKCYIQPSQLTSNKPNPTSVFVMAPIRTAVDTHLE